LHTHEWGPFKKIEENTVTCPNNRAKFDVTTGKVVSGPKVFLMHPKIKDEPTYAVKVERKDILPEREQLLCRGKAKGTEVPKTYMLVPF